MSSKPQIIKLTNFSQSMPHLTANVIFHNGEVYIEHRNYNRDAVWDRLAVDAARKLAAGQLAVAK